jgi:hypothetical protein
MFSMPVFLSLLFELLVLSMDFMTHFRMSMFIMLVFLRLVPVLLVLAIVIH